MKEIPPNTLVHFSLPRIKESQNSPLLFTNLILIQRDVVGYNSSFMIKSHDLKRNIFILLLKFFFLRKYIEIK